MRLVIVEKPSVAQALARVPGANRRFKGYLRRTHWPEGLQKLAKRKEVQCESLARDRAKFRLEFEDTHDAG